MIDRRLHCYVPGKSGMGKSSMLNAWAYQDMLVPGRGLCLLDPKGDTAAMLVENVPESRVADTVYLSADTPAALSVMRAGGDLGDAAQDIHILLTRLFSLGDRMGPVVKWAVHAIMDANQSLSEKGSPLSFSFFDLYKFLAREGGTRELILSNVRSHRIRRFWAEQMSTPYFKGGEHPLIARLTDFALLPKLEAVVGRRTASLTLDDVVDRGMILIVNLKSFGSVASPILGTLVMSQLQQAIFRRDRMRESERVPFFLYCDEFHEYLNATFLKILAQARGFRLSLALANHNPKQAGPVFDAVMGTVSNFVMFSMTASHAQQVRGKIAPWRPEQMESLPAFHALLHSGQGEARLIQTPRLPFAPPNPNHAERIRMLTVEKWSCDPDPDDVVLGQHGGHPDPAEDESKKAEEPPRPEGRAGKGGVPPNSRTARGNRKPK